MRYKMDYGTKVLQKLLKKAEQLTIEEYEKICESIKGSEILIINTNGNEEMTRKREKILKAQKMYNYWRNAVIETMALTANTKGIMTLREKVEFIQQNFVEGKKYTTREIANMGINKKSIKRLYCGGWLSMHGTHDGKVQRTYMIIPTVGLE